MITVSPYFAGASHSDSRELKGMAILSFNEGAVLPFATATSSPSANGYIPNNLCDGRMFLSEDVNIGSYLPPQLRSVSRGWRSAATSDVAGSIDVNVTINYIQPVTTNTLFMRGLAGSMPKDFKLMINGNVIEEITDNVETLWVYKLPAKMNISQVRFEITKIDGSEDAVHIIECGALKTLVLDDDLLVDFNCIMETKPSDAGPLGGISSSELTLTLNNEEGWFTQNRTNSLVSDVLAEPLFVKVYAGLLLSTGQFEYVPWGEYEVSDWKAPSTTLEAQITAFDRLYRVGNLDTPVMPTLRNVTTHTLVRRLLVASGIPESLIDIPGDGGVQVPIGWISRGKVYDALNELIMITNEALVVSRDGKFTILSKFRSRQAVANWTDDNQIMQLDKPIYKQETYEGLRIVYQVPQISGYTTIAQVPEVEVLPGTNIVRNLPITTNYPIVSVGRVTVKRSQDISLQNAVLGSWEADVTIINSTPTEKRLELEVYGTVATTNNFTYRTDDTPGRKLLGIETHYLQSLTAVATFAQKVLPVVTGEESLIECTIRGDMSVELLDSVFVSSVADKMQLEEMQIDRMTIRYDGGLEMTVEGHSPKTEVLYAFIAPGMVIQIPKEIGGI